MWQYSFRDVQSGAVNIAKWREHTGLLAGSLSGQFLNQSGRHVGNCHNRVRKWVLLEDKVKTWL